MAIGTPQCLLGNVVHGQSLGRLTMAKWHMIKTKMLLNQSIAIASQTEGKMPGIQDTLDQGHFTFLEN